MSFLSVILLYKESVKCRECSLKLLLSTSYVYSLYFGTRMILYIFYPSKSLLYSQPLSVITYTVYLLCSIVFTFSYNVLLNKKFVKKTIEDQKNLNAIFNTNPDILIITKLSDGKIIKVNEGFSKHLYFSEEEALNKMTTELGLWVTLSERDTFINTVKELGNI